MIYNFFLPEDASSKSKKLSKKINRINSLVENERKIEIGVSVSTFCLLTLVNYINENTIFYGQFFPKLLFSVVFGLFVFSFIDMFFNKEKVYKEMCKELDSSIFVKEIDVYNSYDLETKELNFPSIHIFYDVHKISDNMAVIIRVSEDKYKILKYINIEKISNNQSSVISSDDIQSVYKELDNNELLDIKVCTIKNKSKKEKEYICSDDIDIRAIVSEGFIFEYED